MISTSADKTDAKKTWEKCSAFIRDNIKPESYVALFEKLNAVSLEDKTLTLSVPSAYIYEYIEENYIDVLSSALKKVLGAGAKLEYTVIVAGEKTPSLPSKPPVKQINKSINALIGGQDRAAFNPFIIPGLSNLQIDPQLNPSYTFENYIEGDCNRTAREIGLAIAKNPGINTFNPFFVYGGSGLGKTHLIQAIGTEVCRNLTNKTVLYINAHKFQNQFTTAILKNNTNDFLHFYQMIDVLIIDDVQDLAGKPSTQDAFFHILDNLHRLKKQVILSSDKAPVDLVGLEQRLLSRFKWGTSVDLTCPDFTTRLAIVKNKVHTNGVELSEDILEFIAENVNSNIRELEGTLNSLMAQSTFNKQAIDMDLVKNIINRLIKNTHVDISISHINKVVSSYFGLTVEKLMEDTRKREIVQARQIAMFFCKNYTNSSLVTIGSQMGGKNHATVLHACKTVENLMVTDRNYKNTISSIEKKLSI